jgi:hypothetical protein
MISSNVKPRPRRLAHSLEKRIIRFCQLRCRGFLDNLYASVIGVDLEFLGIIRNAFCGLNFCHAIRQNLSHHPFFGVDRARIEAILDRVSKCDDTERENRDAKKNLVQGEGVEASKC